MANKCNQSCKNIHWWNKYPSDSSKLEGNSNSTCTSYHSNPARRRYASSVADAGDSNRTLPLQNAGVVNEIKTYITTGQNSWTTAGNNLLKQLENSRAIETITASTQFLGEKLSEGLGIIGNLVTQKPTTVQAPTETRQQEIQRRFVDGFKLISSNGLIGVANLFVKQTPEGIGKAAGSFARNIATNSVTFAGPALSKALTILNQRIAQAQTWFAKKPTVAPGVSSQELASRILGQWNINLDNVPDAIRNIIIDFIFDPGFSSELPALSIPGFNTTAYANKYKHALNVLRSFQLPALLASGGQIIATVDMSEARSRNDVLENNWLNGDYYFRAKIFRGLGSQPWNGGSPR